MLIKHIQDHISCYILFIKCVVLVDESKEGVNLKMEVRKTTLEAKDFKWDKESRRNI